MQKALEQRFHPLDTMLTPYTTRLLTARALYVDQNVAFPFAGRFYELSLYLKSEQLGSTLS